MVATPILTSEKGTFSEARIGVESGLVDASFGDLDLPPGVDQLAEPIGWRCRACQSTFTLSDFDAARLRPVSVVEMLCSSADQHLSHGCLAG